MNYNIRVNFRANEEQARILRAIQRKEGAETLSEAARLAVVKMGEVLEVTPAIKPERQPEAMVQ